MEDTLPVGGQRVGDGGSLRLCPEDVAVAKALSQPCVEVTSLPTVSKSPQ